VCSINGAGQLYFQVVLSDQGNDVNLVHYQLPFVIFIWRNSLRDQILSADQIRSTFQGHDGLRIRHFGAQLVLSQQFSGVVRRIFISNPKDQIVTEKGKQSGSTISTLSHLLTWPKSRFEVNLTAVTTI